MRAPRNLPFLLKLYFIVGGVIVAAFALMYNDTLIRRMRAQTENTTALISRSVAMALRQPADADNRAFIRAVRDRFDIPFILTDVRGVPWVWNEETGVPPIGDEEYERIERFDPAAPSDPFLEKVLAIAESYDRANRPIPIEGGGVSLMLHYGSSSLTRALAVAPYVQLAVLVVFLLIGFFGFRAIKLGEQRMIWVGLAKETAHQLGTPLSSIMGWLEMVREELAAAGCSEKLERAIDEMSTDIDRLGRISARFSKIGSAPKLELQELPPIIEETVAYFERRRPALRINSTITTEFEELPLIRCSRELIGWVVENLIKNSLDAMADGDGKIHIHCRMNKSEGRVEVLVSDTGKGMVQRVRARVFDPGFTTKNRGWGLGLALVKRIVEEMHNGAIRVLVSQPGKGTTFLISFPVD
jgi:nitrogen-specific signal transduction histidine kinase